MISTKTSSRRIDIDSEYYIFHIKVKKLDNFNQWVNALRAHRLARQHEINYGNSLNNATCDNGLVLKTNEQSSDLPVTKLNELEINDDLFRLQEKLIKLSSLLKLIEVSANSSSVTDLEGFKYKKPRRRFHLRKKKSNQSKSNEHAVENQISSSTHREDQLSLRNDNFLSLSHPSLNEEDCGSTNSTATQAEIEEQKPLSKTEAMSQFIQLANQGLTCSRFTLLQIIAYFTTSEQYLSGAFEDVPG